MIRITGMNSGLDTEAIITELMSAYKTKGDKYVKEQTKLSWKQEAWQSLNSKIFSFYKKAGNMKLDGAYNLKKVTVSDSTKAAVTAESDAVNGTQKLKVKRLATGKMLTGGKLRDGYNEGTKFTTFGLGEGEETTIHIGGKDITVKGSTTIEDFVKQINESGADVKATYDKGQQRFYISSTNTGDSANFDLSASNEKGNAVLQGLGLMKKDDRTDGTGDPTVSDAHNAWIELNGVSYFSDSNVFNINGFKIEAQAETGEEEISFTTSTDVDGIYDTIKDFLSEYNSLISEMSKLYNADSAKDYEPLTDEEKEAMSESEIEKWEDKIKGSLLRRDSTLSSIISSLTTGFLSATAIGKHGENAGKQFSLSSLGIGTLGYFEVEADKRNELHIDGDADDEDTAEKKDELRAMIEEDPDLVIELMKKFAGSIYDNLDKKLSTRTELSSMYKVYNDKEMAIQYSDYTKTISAWEKKMQQIEDNYYQKFSKMETALAKLQSQTSSLSSLFG